MICYHECPTCGQTFQHLCDTPPKEAIGLILVLAYSLDYMPPCEKSDYFIECSDCHYQRYKLK